MFSFKTFCIQFHIIWILEKFLFELTSKKNMILYEFLKEEYFEYSKKHITDKLENLNTRCKET